MWLAFGMGGGSFFFGSLELDLAEEEEELEQVEVGESVECWVSESSGRVRLWVGEFSGGVAISRLGGEEVSEGGFRVAGAGVGRGGGVEGGIMLGSGGVLVRLVVRGSSGVSVASGGVRSGRFRIFLQSSSSPIFSSAMLFLFRILLRVSSKDPGWLTSLYMAKIMAMCICW